MAFHSLPCYLLYVVTSSLENIPCMLVTREAENTGNSHTGQYSLQTYVTGFWHNLSKKKGGRYSMYPLFCSDSGQWVFDYDSFGIMAQNKWSFFLSVYVKWTPPLEKKYEQAWIKLVSKLLPGMVSQLGVFLLRVFIG